MRVYTDGGSYEQKSSFVAVATIVWDSETQVTLKGLHGDVNKSILLTVKEALRNRGVTHYRQYRNNRWQTKPC
mgnify:CR=1 FL=1